MGFRSSIDIVTSLFIQMSGHVSVRFVVWHCHVFIHRVPVVIWMNGGSGGGGIELAGWEGVGVVNAVKSLGFRWVFGRIFLLPVKVSWGHVFTSQSIGGKGSNLSSYLSVFSWWSLLNYSVQLNRMGTIFHKELMAGRVRIVFVYELVGLFREVAGSEVPPPDIVSCFNTFLTLVAISCWGSVMSSTQANLQK